MTRLVCVMWVAGLVAAGQVVLAATPEQTKEEDGAEGESSERTPVWSVGAGVGFGTTAIYSSGLSGIATGTSTTDAIGGIGYGGLGGYSFGTPRGLMLVERLLGDSFAVMLRLSGYTSDQESWYPDGDRHGSAEVSGLGADIGLRWIVNPGGIVEVSAYLAIGGDWTWVEEEYGYFNESNRMARQESYGYQLGMRAGVVLERELIDRLYLRLGSSLASLSYSWSELKSWDEDGPGPKRTSKNTGGGLVFSPSIQLRLLF